MRILLYKTIDEYMEKELQSDTIDPISCIMAYGFPALQVGDLWNDKYKILGIYLHDASDCYWIVIDVDGTLFEENITEWYNKYMDDMIPF